VGGGGIHDEYCGRRRKILRGGTGTGRAIAQAVSCRLPTAAARVRVEPSTGYVPFVVDKVTLG
jgi:hypothetical protein